MKAIKKDESVDIAANCLGFEAALAPLRTATRRFYKPHDKLEDVVTSYGNEINFFISYVATCGVQLRKMKNEEPR